MQGVREQGAKQHGSSQSPMEAHPKGGYGLLKSLLMKFLFIFKIINML
jgi:hypothetical protein